MMIFKLINFLGNRLELFRHDLHRDVFGHVWLMCKNDLLFVGPNFLSATLTENIAVSLHLLLYLVTTKDLHLFKNQEHLNAKDFTIYCALY